MSSSKKGSGSKKGGGKKRKLEEFEVSQHEGRVQDSTPGSELFVFEQKSNLTVHQNIVLFLSRSGTGNFICHPEVRRKVVAVQKKGVMVRRRVATLASTR